MKSEESRENILILSCLYDATGLNGSNPVRMHCPVFHFDFFKLAFLLVFICLIFTIFTLLSCHLKSGFAVEALYCTFTFIVVEYIN